jgi:Predicted transcriptional regulators
MGGDRLNKLGKRIRELRIKNDMSQEYVAKMLGVSPQAISKWENGKAYPEIFNLIPLSDLFHVTVDALLDKEEHHKQLEDKWLSILTSENRLESINYMKAALEEYPGDYKFRYRLANEEFFMAEEAIDPEEKRRWLALSYDHLDSMRKEFPEFTLAVDLQVRVLAAMGHRAEAIVAAKSSPNQERLLLLALEGEALEAQKKKLLTIGLLNLFADLMRFGTMQAIERAEKLLTVVAKGDRQFSSMLLELYYRKAQLCFAAGDKCGTIEALKAGQDTLRTCDGEDGNSQFGKNTIFGPLIPVKPYNELLEQFLAYISDARFHEIYNLLE